MCHDPVIELRLDHFSCNGRACTVGSLSSFLGKASVGILTLTVPLVYVWLFYSHLRCYCFLRLVLLFQRRTDMIATLA